jgi:mercuric ion transport protein
MSIEENPISSEREDKGKLVATLSVVTAILASSCCILPLLFIMLGISGSWIGNLTAMEPYKPYFIAITLVFLGLGFWKVYFKANKNCEEDTYCAKPSSDKITKIILWSATGMILLAATIDYWAPYFY